MDLGFIGLGGMGQAMAFNLVRAGHRMFVYNRTPGKADQLCAAGAVVAASPADACRGEAVITMLSDDDAVAATVFGKDGMLATLRHGAIHVSMSTISVGLSERLARAHGDARQGFVAAPVLGRPDAAAAAKLFVLAGGAPDLVERCQPLFGAMGQRTFIVGEHPAQANLVKLAANFLIAATLESLGEAFALTRKSGIDPHQFLEILIGTIFTAPIHKTYGALIADQKFEPAGFRMQLGLKDIRLALAAADATLVPMPVASVIHDQLLAGVAGGKGDTDWSGLAEIAARNAGL